jgi:H+/Cl- antiporter ClcA
VACLTTSSGIFIGTDAEVVVLAQSTGMYLKRLRKKKRNERAVIIVKWGGGGFESGISHRRNRISAL